MNRGREVTVGAVLLSALVLLGLAMYFLLGIGTGAGRYPVHVIFPEAPVQKGDYVRLAGVKVGEVQSAGGHRAVELTEDNEAMVTILLDRDVKIRERYRIQVTSGILVGTNQIDITPVRPGGKIVRPGATLRGTRSPQLADLMAETQRAVAQLRKAAESVTGILSNEKLLGAVEEALGQVGAVGKQVAELGRVGHSALKELLPPLRQTAADVAEAARHASEVAAGVDEILADPALKESLSQVAKNLASVSERLDKTAAAVQQIVEAPEFGQDVQAAVKNASEAMESIKRAADSVEKTSDAVRDVAERAGKVAEKVTRLGVNIPKASGSVSVERLTGRDNTWIEANATLDMGNRLLRIGLTDVGETARVNLQLGRPAGRGTLRMGLVQSELGLGYDLALGRSATLSVDLFDPNDVRMNLLGYRSLAPGYEAVLGMRDVGRDNRVSVGVRATR